ncbi:MAG: GAF domain-containing protein [Ktedonobacteraceae bacterium]|nr:GAF domain-containing protein [Ktedonobacteraceae bacterium]
MMNRQISKFSSMAERFAALNRVGIALMSEMDEKRLLHMIAETACDLTDAAFAAFTLRSVDETGQPKIPVTGNPFYLAAVVGVTQDQEELFRRMPLGGEGLLLPIFQQGIPVLVADALSFQHAHNTAQNNGSKPQENEGTTTEETFTFAHDLAPLEELQAIGVPHGHPVIRSFLGVPVLDRAKHVRGGLLLGHDIPGRFTLDDKELLVGLAAQAAVALENARLYRMTQMRAQELNTIFESIADGVTLVDRQGTIRRENGPARHLRERFQESVQGKQAIEDMLHGPALCALNSKITQSSEVSVEDAYNETRQYVITASPLISPGTPSGALELEHVESDQKPTGAEGAVVVWRDVTEARRLLSERRLHAETETRRALLQLVLDELPGSVYLVRGHDARLVLANKAAATLWGAQWPIGLSMSDFLQQNSIRIFGNDGHELTPDQRATLRAVQNHETVHHQQEVIRHADGTALPVLVNAVALDAQVFNALPIDIPGMQIPREEESAAIVVHQDVTALKEAERMKDDFIGIAAHELRTPLAILKGFSQMLIVQTARGNGLELADWQTEALQSIDLATSRMVELIDDLLDVTRLQAQHLELYIEPNDIVALARRVLTRQQITTKKHTFSLIAPFEYLVVQIDPRRIEQVFNNLINNAIKYSPAGGPIIITIGTDTTEQMAVISIHDSGIGIPTHQQAHVFGRFVRADNARSNGIGGTGLGLYLCRELVEHHAGHIWFESTEGLGSTFFLTLPLLIEEDMDV